MQTQFFHIAGYKFLKLENLNELQASLQNSCRRLELKGTILLSAEGINIMLAGTQSATEIFKENLTADIRFADIDYKTSLCESIPFRRLLVKIKKQIIAFSPENINPAEFTAPNLPPQQFKQWLDQQKDITVLDVRNECEIEAGTFTGAVDLKLNQFRNFAAAAKNLPAEAKKKPLVMFCTGGIRCEKASAYLLEEGFEEVYQLQGGILGYFAECGQDHYQGKCFVFDDRRVVGVKEILNDRDNFLL